MSSTLWTFSQTIALPYLSCLDAKMCFVMVHYSIEEAETSIDRLTRKSGGLGPSKRFMESGCTNDASWLNSGLTARERLSFEDADYEQRQRNRGLDAHLEH